MSRALVLLLLLGVASALLAGRRGPDNDHFIDEMHDNAVLPKDSKYVKPATDMEKDFVQMDWDGDKHLSLTELMWRQYSSGCEPIEAEVRAADYLRCGDLDSDDLISFEEFGNSAKPAWAECVKKSTLRRAHGMVKFFDSDQNYDDKLSPTELTVGLIKLWGPPGEELVQPLMECSDKNKDGFMDQKEFHASIFAYNPAQRKWVMWSGTSDPSILTCMEAAFHKFDAALVFHATDKNKDGRLSQQELYDTVHALNPATIDHSVIRDMIKAADKDKNGWLNVEEFETAGEAYKGPNEASFFLSGRSKAAVMSAWPIDSYNEGYGMSVQCHSHDEGVQWRVYSDELGAVRVTPTDDQGAVKVTQR